MLDSISSYRLGRVAVEVAAGAWLVACSPPAGAGPAAAPMPTAQLASGAGSERLFIQAGCGGCHTLDGVPGATGIAGPNLTNVTLRPTLAGDVVPMTRETMITWLLEPTALKPDARMPSVGLTPQEASDLAAFLFGQPATHR
jgi:cytochrome c